MSTGRSAPKNVLICIGDHPDAGDVALQLTTDLLESGYTTASGTRCGLDRDVSPVELMSAAGVQALIVIEDPGRPVDIWVRDRRDDTLRHRSVEVAGEDARDVSLVALRIAELLRAVFIELKNRPQREATRGSMRQKKEPTKQVGTIARGREETDEAGFNQRSKPAGMTKRGETRRPDRENARDVVTPTPAPGLLLELDGTTSFPSLKHSPTGHLLLAASLFFGRVLGVECLSFIPLMAQTFRREEGKVTLVNMSVGTGISLSHRFSDRVRFISGVGVMMGIMLARGHARDGYRSSEKVLFSALPYGRTSISIRVYKWVSCRLGVWIAAPLPETHIMANGREAIELSPVFLRGFMGVDIAFPRKR